MGWKMRDINRIDRMLKLLKELWLLTPDQRLGQLIDNIVIVNRGADTFNIEDDIMEEQIKILIARYGK